MNPEREARFEYPFFLKIFGYPAIFGWIVILVALLVLPFIIDTFSVIIFLFCWLLSAVGWVFLIYGIPLFNALYHTYSIDEIGIYVSSKRRELKLIKWDQIAFVKERKRLQTLELRDRTNKPLLMIDFLLTDYASFKTSIEEHSKWKY